MHEPWRELRVGDRIRIVKLPSYPPASWFKKFPETRRLDRKLIARNRAVKVYQIDKFGVPWICCVFRDKRTGWECHFLAVDDDSWVKVKRRGRTHS